MKLEEFKNLVKSFIPEQSVSGDTGAFAIPSKSYLAKNKKTKIKEAIRLLVKKKIMEDSSSQVFDISGLSPQEQEAKKKEITSQNPGKKIVFKTE